jgi:hypothetical protein
MIISQFQDSPTGRFLPGLHLSKPPMMGRYRKISNTALLRQPSHDPLAKTYAFPLGF